MFASFFPRPKLFFLSAFLWFLAGYAIWKLGVQDLHTSINFIQQPELADGEPPPFLTSEKLWTYIFIVVSSFLFCIGWAVIERKHPWFRWSVFGSAGILVFTYFNVQVNVWLNSWFGSFFDLINETINNSGSVTIEDYYAELSTVGYVLFPFIIFLLVFSFFNAHYNFRWRTAMNNYYMSHWGKLRNVEGASQRVQEDCKEFSNIMESLGSEFISSVMTLLAFLPLLWTLSEQITELPFLGEVEGSLVYVAILSAMFGTVLLMLVGIRLPGLEFNNQKEEAAYRKELVYGEEDPSRASPPSVIELYGNVRKNYFRIYAEYTYFNFFRYMYLRGASLVPFFILGPSLVAGALTLGVFQQIRNAYSQVENSFQYLVNSWPTIIKLISIYKRLKAFEMAIDDEGSLDNSKYGSMREPNIGLET